MDTETLKKRTFYKLTALVAFVSLVLGAGWYFVSPLFLVTYADEALPTAKVVAAATAPVAAATVPVAAPTGAGASIPAVTANPVATPVTQTGVVSRDLTKGTLQYVDSLHHGKGEVRLVEVGATKFLRFEAVAISNAPDIHVYLSKDVGGRYVEANSLYLGVLRATNGSFNYELPAGTDVSQFKSVVIWCRNFSTLITWANLN